MEENEQEQEEKEGGLNWNLSASDLFVIGILILGMSGILFLLYILYKILF